MSSRHSIRHSIRHGNLGFLAVPVLLIAACGPGESGDATLDADGAEAPPIQRPTTAPDFAEWDGDGDLTLDSAEFGAWAEDEGPFDGWFEDDTLNVAAMQEDVLSSLDVSGEGQVDQNDWEAASEGLRRLFGGEHPGDFAEWDADGNGELDADEFRQAAQARGLGERVDIDGDGRVSRQDLHGYYFGLLDETGDGRIDRAEWSESRSAWMDLSM